MAAEAAVTTALIRIRRVSGQPLQNWHPQELANLDFTCSPEDLELFASIVQRGVVWKASQEAVQQLPWVQNNSPHGCYDDELARSTF